MPDITPSDLRPVNEMISTIDARLRGSNAYANRRIRVPQNPTNSVFVTRVLTEFDKRNLRQLHQEARQLSEEGVHTGNSRLPASYQREVIKEALSDLKVLELVNTSVDPGASSTVQIPYEKRIGADSIPNNGIVFEGNGIPFSGVGMESENAFLMPMRLAAKLSDEVLHFTRASEINWDAWAENIASNARLIRELIHLRVVNEMIRASDSYQAKKIESEAFTASESGLIKTTQFPVVRPFQAYDLRGEKQGFPISPLTLIINGVVIPEFTGSEDLPQGVYWYFKNTNLGYIQLVDNTGQPAGAGASGAISYYQATNLIKFDLHHPAEVNHKKYLNELLDAVGDQSAELISHRYSRPDYAVMSAILNNEASKAEQFAFWQRRPGTNATIEGDLDTIKSIPAFGTNAPGTDLSDNRILLGQQGLTTYKIAKPFSFGAPFEAVGKNGNPTGEKIAYGEEFSAVHTPSPICGQYTSVLVFDSTKR